MTSSERLRVVSYSSGNEPCGINDYNRHLLEALDTYATTQSFKMPVRRVPRHHLGELLAMRREYAALAARSDGNDVALLQFETRFWNGGRAGENMLPLFLQRIHCPTFLVLHEWPKLPGRSGHHGSWLARAGKSALTSALVARDLGRQSYVEWVESGMFARLAGILVHTEEFRERLVASGISKDRVHLHPFPLHELPVPAWSANDTRTRFGLQSRRVILLLGFPVERKGFDLAVQALPSLPVDVTLVLVCSDRRPHEREQIAALREAASCLGVADRLVTTGYLDDSQLASMLDIATLALAPFRSISGSSSTAHCFAAGVPVLTTDLPPMRQALADGAGVTLFETESVAALSRCVNETLLAPAKLEHMREANRAYSHTHSFASLAASLHSYMMPVARHRERTAS